MKENEHDQQIYGRLQEGAHVSGYTFNRMCNHLEHLLENERWRKVGAGFTDISTFVRTIDLSPFNFDTPKRKRMAEKMRLAGASNRAIADAVGVGRSTVNRDTSGPNGPQKNKPTKGKMKVTGPNGPLNGSQLDEPEDTPEVIWRRGIVNRASASAGAALYEDWSKFAVDLDLIKTAKKAAGAWNKTAEYLNSLYQKQRKEVKSRK